MKPILIAYATPKATPERSRSTSRGRSALGGGRPHCARRRRGRWPLHVADYEAAILAASEKEMERFIMRERESLARIPTAFISVSLAEAGVENPDQPDERRAEAARELVKITDAFFEKKGWHPDRTQPTASSESWRSTSPP